MELFTQEQYLNAQNLFVMGLYNYRREAALAAFRRILMVKLIERRMKEDGMELSLVGWDVATQSPDDRNRYKILDMVVESNPNYPAEFGIKLTVDGPEEGLVYNEAGRQLHDWRVVTLQKADTDQSEESTPTCHRPWGYCFDKLTKQVIWEVSEQISKWDLKISPPLPCPNPEVRHIGAMVFDRCRYGLFRSEHSYRVVSIYPHPILVDGKLVDLVLMGPDDQFRPAFSGNFLTLEEYQQAIINPKPPTGVTVAASPFLTEIMKYYEEYIGYWNTSRTRG